MADRDRFRRDDFDDDERYSPPSNTDNTGTIIATIFGVWAAIIGGIGLIWVIVFLCFVAIFLFVFCIIASIMISIASGAASKMQPPPAPQPPPGFNQPIKPPADKDKPKPRPIMPGWKDDAMKGTWLSDMEEIDPKVGLGQFGKKGKLGYSIKPGEVDSPITFKGQPNPQGISTAPSAFVVASVKYRLGRTYKLFKASVACNDLDPGVAGPNQPMTFRVYGDGDLLWMSEPVSKAGVKQDVRLGVFGVEMLELQVQCSDGNNARAIWLDPQVLK